MSKLEELIKELCPNGVEYKKIGELATYEQPSKYIVKSTDYNDDFDIPVLTAGQSFILGYTNETDGLYKATKEDPVIIFDDFTGAFKWVNFTFKVKSSAMKMIKANTEITSLRYLFHLMGFLNFTSSEHKRLWISTYSEFMVPVPPLEVQHEIVRILDNFTGLTAELTAELTARKRQYEYCRENLFVFDENNRFYEDAQTLCPNGIKSVSLGEITDINSFKQVSAEALKKLNTYSGNIKLLPSSQNYDWFCEESNIDDCLICEDEVFTMGRARYANIKYVNGKFLSSNNNIIKSNNTSKVLTKYIYYFVASHIDDVYVSTSTYPKFDKNLFYNLQIPIPPIEIQKKIVHTLDYFDKLCGDILTGLPAEIEVRQKQYEYYRDKLLDFKEVK